MSLQRSSVRTLRTVSREAGSASRFQASGTLTTAQRPTTWLLAASLRSPLPLSQIKKACWEAGMMTERPHQGTSALIFKDQGEREHPTEGGSSHTEAQAWNRVRSQQHTESWKTRTEAYKTVKGDYFQPRILYSHKWPVSLSKNVPLLPTFPVSY